MKNLKFLLILIALSVTAACGEQTQTPPATDEARQQEPVKAPGGIISLEEARADYKLYEERRVPLIRHYEDSIFRSQRIDSVFPAARYVSFDYEQLKQYMKYIEQRAGEAKTSIRSLRIYFSNNPDQDGYMHPKQNSVFLLPAVQPDPAQPEEYGLYINTDGTPAYLTMDLQFWKPDGMGMRENGTPRAEASMLPVPTAASMANGSLILNEGGSSPPPNN